MVAGLTLILLTSLVRQGQDFVPFAGPAVIIIIVMQMGGGAKDGFVWLTSGSARWPSAWNASRAG